MNVFILIIQAGSRGAMRQDGFRVIYLEHSQGKAGEGCPVKLLGVGVWAHTGLGTQHLNMPLPELTDWKGANLGLRLSLSSGGLSRVCFRILSDFGLILMLMLIIVVIVIMVVVTVMTMCW